MLKDSTEQGEVWTKQFLARETLQKVDKSVINLNYREYVDLMAYTQEAMNIADEIQQMFTVDQLLGMMSNISKDLLYDFYIMEDEIVRKSYILSDLYVDTYLGNEPVIKPFNFTTDLLAFLGLDNAENILAEQLSACLGVYDEQENNTNCDALVMNSLNMIKYFKQNGVYVKSRFVWAYNYYVRILNDLYKDSPIALENLTEHQKSLSSYENAIYGDVGAGFAEILDTLAMVLNTTTSPEYITAVGELTDFVNSTRFSDVRRGLSDVISHYYGSIADGTQWDDFYKFGDIIQHEANNIDFLISSVEKFALPEVKKVEDLLYDNVLPIVDQTTRYMNGSLWKLQLYENLQYAIYRGTADSVDVAVTGLLVELRTAVFELELIELQLLKGFRGMFELKLPVLINDLFDKLEFIKRIRSLGNPTLDSLLDRLYIQQYKTDIMSEIITEVFKLMYDPMQDLSIKMLDMSNNLVAVMDQQQSRLHQFAQDVTMSETFYL